MQENRRLPKKLGEDDYPLRDQICDQLRERICDGRLAPGARLVEQTLADEFGVSRVPVREALRMLLAEGLIITLPRRGAVVTTLTEADLVHLFDIREALEVLAFRLAARNAGAGDVARLRAILTAAAAATETGDHIAVTRHNTEFHEAVIDIAGNPFLRTTLEPLLGRLRLLIGRGHAHEWQLAEHLALVDAIERHDTEAVAAAALEHVRVSRERTLAQTAGATETA
ncbi:GntR family transcriptional regulator [Nocardia sp. BMG51109]|uniref:GntR family transcriptional regulator n=1 Tax=Nocardia sp. BMG51109 TaxID=1056816 RepID=UPI0004B2090A|nr:GntR family transcriptional regulator [Nocardia sp. BMG51109]